MTLLRLLSGGLAQSLRLSAAYQQQAACFHVSAALDARQRAGTGPTRKGSDSDSSDSEWEDTPKAEQPSTSGSDPAESEAQLPLRFDPSLVKVAAGEKPAALSSLLFDATNDRYDVNTLISPVLAAAIEEAPEGQEGAQRALEEWADATERLERGEKLKGDEPASDADLLAVAEAIDLYFLAAPFEEPEVDEMDEIDRDTLEALGDSLKEVLGGGARTTVVSIAPPGQMPWEVLDVDDEHPMVNWGVDLTEGKAHDPWKNAQLSSEAKDTMWEMHHKRGWTAAQLAEHFRIRQQRAAAILALKEREHLTREAGGHLYTDLQEGFDELHNADEVIGSGERNHVVLPSYPNYKELTEEDADRLAALLEKRLGKRFDDIQLEDMTPEVTQELLAAAGVSKEAVEEELAMREEEFAVAEFRQALEFNLGKTGTSLHRESRKTHPPTRPAEGWSLLVTPLGKAAHEGTRQAYVVAPDGSKRELTEDEQLNLAKQQPRPRYKVV